MILVGDLNTVQGYLDHENEFHYTEQNRKREMDRLRFLVTELGMVDTYREQNPKKRALTYCCKS